jgi:hypothetical protein
VQKKYGPKFEEFCRKRDTTTNGRKEYYQEKVDEYFGRMYSEGYYRDSYNDSNLLWRLGLDYGEWFGSFLDSERLLHPEKAEVILQEAENRRHLLEEIEDTGDREYFEEKFEQFSELLRTAIRTGEPIQCSI